MSFRIILNKKSNDHIIHIFTCLVNIVQKDAEIYICAYTLSSSPPLHTHTPTHREREREKEREREAERESTQQKERKINKPANKHTIKNKERKNE